MSKILLVIRREYMSRVRKRSFIVMTFLAPLLLVSFYGIIIYLSVNKDIGETGKIICVSDSSGLFRDKLQRSENMEFVYAPVTPGTEEKLLDEAGYYGLLIIPPINPDHPSGVRLIAKEQAPISTIGQIEAKMDNELRNARLDKLGIGHEVLEEINRSKVRIKTQIASAGRIEAGSSIAATTIGFAGAFVTYMFILLYGLQVMRGVLEEKTNRIVEVIISSVRPFELMMGKIVGIALVGLTQFLIWILLVTILGGAVQLTAGSAIGVQAGSAGGEAADLINGLTNFKSYPLLISMFVFYFIGGYLFYGALFAAIGSAVDSETDTQQFMLPVTMPLIFAFGLAQSAVISNPGSTLSFWLSVIPFTSPVVMMVRLPFDVPAWQIGVSMLGMIAGFMLTVWLAGRIYRVGILMYGKKTSYRELIKWLRYNP